ncbi:PaaI family thioesterase [Marinibaculum pumilum]|uniref:PaaI family thioesterase n=1 Tax=Marinibaculum pumilum TaxID=1766165 RepID=A0ABV7KUH6_9PROT
MTEFTRDAAEKILNENFAPWVRALDMRFERIGDGEVVMVAPFAEALVRQGGIMSGQAMMCLADTAMVFALLARAGSFVPCASVDIHSTFMRPVANADMHCHAQVIRAGKSMAFLNASITAGADGPLAFQAVGTYALPQG